MQEMEGLSLVSRPRFLLSPSLPGNGEQTSEVRFPRRAQEDRAVSPGSEAFEATSIDLLSHRWFAPRGQGEGHCSDPSAAQGTLKSGR